MDACDMKKPTRPPGAKTGDATFRRGKASEAGQEQYQRFLDAAREHGCEGNVDRLDDVVRQTAKLPATRPAAKRRKTEAEG